MRHAILTCALLLAPLPPAAQEAEDTESMMQRGMELFLEGLRQEMDPALQDLRALSDQLGPAMRDFLAYIGPALGDLKDRAVDWTQYHPPEVLPNGDIILRRKEPPAEDPEAPAPSEEPEPGEQIDI